MEWLCEVTITVNDAEIEMFVGGTPVRNDPSVGEPHGWGLEGAVLLWPNEKPVEDAMLHMIGDKQHRHAINVACDKLAMEGPA